MSHSLDNPFGRKRFEVGKRGVLQATCEFSISSPCDEPMLPDMLQYNLFQLLPVPLFRSTETDTSPTFQISPDTGTERLGCTEIHSIKGN